MSKKKAALITGGTVGIGKELARCFARNGYTIIIVSDDGYKLKKTADELKNTYKADISTINVDVSLPGAAQKIIAELKGMQVDILINSAGTALQGVFADEDSEKLMGIIRTNIESLTELTRLIVPQMIDRRSGKILNLATMAAFQPGPLMSVYSASKAYVLSFSEAIRYELKGTGVTVSTLCPESHDSHKTKYSKSMQEIAELAYYDLMDERSIIVPGFKNKIKVFLTRIYPRKFAIRFLNR